MNRAPVESPQACKWAADGSYYCDAKAAPASADMTQAHVYGRERFELAPRMYAGEPRMPPPRIMYGKRI